MIMTFFPNLRFPGFEGEWKINRFQEVVKINQGLQIPISNRLIRPRDGAYFYITNEFLKDNSEKKFFIKNPPLSVLCNKEDILMTRTGNTGKVVTDVEGAFHNNFFKVSYPKNIVKGFLYNFLKLPSIQNQISKLAGTSTIPDLNHSDFYRIKFSYPKLEEQRKISEFVSFLDSRIQTQKKIIEQLETLMRANREKLFSQKLRFKEEHGNDFSAWERKKIKDILTIGSGKDYKHLNNGAIPVYGTGGIITFVDSFLYDGETVCIGRKGTIDKPLYYNGKIWTVDTLFYTHSFNNSVPRFVFNIFQNINWKEYNEASGVPSLSKNTIEKIEITIPCLEEQTKIANFLSTIQNKIETEKQILEKLELQKKFLLANLFV